MGALGLDLWGFIVQLIAFMIFVFLFWKFALGPITSVLDKRTESVKESLAAAERMKAELAATATCNEEILNEARREAQQIVAQAKVASDATIARAQEAAAAQAGEYQARAEATIRQEVEQARLQLRQEVADLSVSAAEKIVRKNLDPAAQAALIAEALAQASN